MPQQKRQANARIAHMLGFADQADKQFLEALMRETRSFNQSVGL